MKKILALILMLLITLSIFASCNEKVPNEDSQAATNEQSENLTQTEKQTQKETTKKETSKKETSKKETTKQETTKTYTESTAGLYFELNTEENGYILASLEFSKAKEIVIDGHKGLPVVDIGFDVLKDNQNIVKLTISGEIKTLPEKSFYNCPSLKTVIIKDKLTHIGPSAFENCTSLETVQIGNGVTLIDKFAFNNCTSLKNLTLGNKVQTIEMCAFQNCSSLTSIVIPASARLIKESSFWDCDNITNVEFKSPNNWCPDIEDPGLTYDLTDKQAAATLLLHGLGFRKY